MGRLPHHLNVVHILTSLLPRVVQEVYLLELISVTPTQTALSRLLRVLSRLLQVVVVDVLGSSVDALASDEVCVSLLVRPLRILVAQHSLHGVLTQVLEIRPANVALV